MNHSELLYTENSQFHRYFTEDRNRLPDSYWTRLRDTQFSQDDTYGMSYGLTTLYSGVVTFHLELPDVDGHPQLDSVQFYTQREVIGVSPLEPNTE